MLYQFEFRTYQRKFKRPLRTSHGIWDIREGIILRVVDENNQIGWGEIAPLSWFGSESFEQALDFCHQLPGNISSEMIFAISAQLPACQFGFESALSNSRSPLTKGGHGGTAPTKGGTRNILKVPLIKGDLGGSRLRIKSTLIAGSVLRSHQSRKGGRNILKVPLIKGDLGGSRLRLKSTLIAGSVLRSHQSKEVGNEEEKNRFSGLLPAGETALQALQVLWLEGYRTFKWKIGVAAIEQELKIFQQLIQAIHNLCDREKAFLRLDANGGLSYSQAKTWLEACDKVKATPDFSADIEFLEQPLPVTQFQEMVELNAIYATDLALDESAANLDRIQECYSQGWRGIFVIKPAICGSPSQLRKFCKTHNIDAVFSSVFETEIGRQAALNLATELSLNNRALGFGTDSWFDDNHSILDFRF
ncbi:o-succinylbenzoate synthase [Microcoleus sp. D3_18a_C4]|uniref:o-succinylbenzoate synthase n=1 Tax=Microcoleus sp. D3_18a_C4 TaxID=3055332 RepID=UPI002FD68E2C